MNPALIFEGLEGHTVDGRFPLLEMLDNSGDCVVFRTTSREVARAVVKLWPAEEAWDAEALLRQWQVAATFEHPNLTRIYESGRTVLGGTSFLFVVTEHAEEVLSNFLRETALDAESILDTLVSVLSALSCLHRKGYVHGQVRPSNILLINDTVKLSGDSLLRSGSVSNPAPPDGHDAPEVGTGPMTAASDIWSLGMTVAESLTQHVPRRWTDAGLILAENLPEPYAKVVRACLKSDPRQRCTIAEIAALLEREAPLPPAEVPLPEPPPVEPPAASPFTAPAPVTAPVAPAAAVEPGAGPAPSAPAVNGSIAAGPTAYPPAAPAPITARPIALRPAPPAPPPPAPVFSDAIRPKPARALEPDWLAERPDWMTRLREAGSRRIPIPAALGERILSRLPISDGRRRSIFERLPASVPLAPLAIGAVVLLLLAVILTPGHKAASPRAVAANHPSSLRPSGIAKPSPYDARPGSDHAPVPRAPSAPRQPAPAPPRAGDDSGPVETPPTAAPVRPAVRGGGSILKRVRPSIAPSATATIRGTVHVIVQASVDTRGNVSRVRYIMTGPSRYFARAAMEAAHSWRFRPPQRNGRSAPSVWSLDFNFTRAKTSVAAVEVE